MKKLELWYPVHPALFTQKFGENPNYYRSAIGTLGHTGIDFVAEDGRNVRASHNGVVTYAGEDGAGGLTCVVRTLEPFEYNEGASFFKTIYCHIKKNSFRVRPGQRIAVGDILAQADNTGLSTGSHLHFGLKPVRPGEADWQWYNTEQDNGFYGAIDSMPYFNGRSAYEATLLLKQIRLLQDKLNELIIKWNNLNNGNSTRPM